MNRELETLLLKHIPSLSTEGRTAVHSFYELLKAENEVQNLTRLISPEDFYYGHLVDVIELLKTGWLQYPALDIGSGGGVPGLLSAVIAPNVWVLSDSEKRKAEFLEQAVRSLGLQEKVKVTSERAEEYLLTGKVGSLVARAVGTVEKIYLWLVNNKTNKSSTWNNLILFKGPHWDEEWKSFQATKFRNELSVQAIHPYKIERQVDGESIEKTRVLILLSRNVPRGTLGVS